MRRREAYAQHPQLPQAPIGVIWATPDPPRAQAGCCPKCGLKVGQRRIRAHAKDCHGNLGDISDIAAADR
jgi:hypothetical protein